MAPGGCLDMCNKIILRVVLIVSFLYINTNWLYTPAIYCTQSLQSGNSILHSFLFHIFYLNSSKGVKTQLNPGVFGSLQNFKDDKTKPVKDEYEYVSDDGELKIDEFPIRRKKNTTKRDLPCKIVSSYVHAILF